MNRQTIKILELIAEEVKSKMIAKLQQHGLASSNFVKNINHFIDDSIADEIELVLKMPSYGVYINSGRRPGKMPPKGKLIDWMNRKGINPKKEFPIRKQIGLRGIPARPFLFIWKEIINQKLNVLLQKSMKEDFELELNEFLKKIKQ